MIPYLCVSRCWCLHLSPCLVPSVPYCPMMRLLAPLLWLVTSVACEPGLWSPVCDDDSTEGDIQIQAEVVTIFRDQEGLSVVVENAGSDVRVRCHNPAPGDNQLYDEEDRAQGSNMTIWRRNVWTFWKSTKRLRCGGCKANFIKIKDERNCSRESGSLTCNIRDWIDTAFTFQKKHAQCNGAKHDAVYEIQFFNPESKLWEASQELDEGKAPVSRYEDVSFLKCNLTGVSVNGSLMVRMVKTHKSQAQIGLSFLKKKPECQESSYFVVQPPQEVSEDSVGINKATIAAISVVLVTIILLAVGCYCKSKLGKRNRQRCDEEKNITHFIDTDDKKDQTLLSSDQQDKEDQNKLSVQDSATFERQCSVKVEANKRALDNNVTEELKQKMIADSMFQGDNSQLNPALPMSQQLGRLHYDRKYERAKESFSVSYILGEGMFGTVYKGEADNIYGPQQTKVAVKQVKDLMRSDEDQINSIILELKIMSNLKMHPNLVNLLGACTSRLEYNEIYLLLEFCPYGDLKHFLVENRSKFESCLRNVPGHLESEFSAQLLLTWSYSIARGLEYLVSASIMHGDLAARNILVGENYVAKISDFGLSKMMYYNEGNNITRAL